MSTISFDLPLDNPITQAILPVMDENGFLHGFIPIARTTFTDPLGPVTTPSNILPTRSVTVPRINDGSNLGVTQYVALVYAKSECYLRPWLGIPELISNEECGMYASWKSPASFLINHYGRGVLLDALLFGMDTTIGSVNSGMPNSNQASFQWKTTVNKSVLETKAFFDFNWVSLVKKAGMDAPVSIQVTSNPPSGIFKASIVQSSIVDNKNVVFDTVRILALNIPQVGIHTFTFDATDGKVVQQCRLTLTIIEG